VDTEAYKTAELLQKIISVSFLKEYMMPEHADDDVDYLTKAKLLTDKGV
jgi:hypothetical protein